MSDDLSSQRNQYVQAVLTAYVQLPDTPNRPRPPDRRLARLLQDRSIPLSLVKDALILTSARRMLRPQTAPPLPPIRSLYYFLPVIEEILHKPLPHGYIQQVSRRLRSCLHSAQAK